MTEVKKQENDRHPVIQWSYQVSEYQKQASQEHESGLMSVVPSGPMMAYFTLAHDIVTLSQHGSFQDKIMEKLKNKEAFHGARYELFVASVMLRAGFDLQYCDDSDNSKKHPEFFAISKISGEKIAVEAKRKNRHTKYAEEDFKEGKNIRLGVRDLLGDACQKQKAFDGIPYVIFLELDLPPMPDNPFSQPWSKELLNLPSDAGFRSKDETDLFSMLIMTNSAVEYTAEMHALC